MIRTGIVLPPELANSPVTQARYSGASTLSFSITIHTSGTGLNSAQRARVLTEAQPGRFWASSFHTGEILNAEPLGPTGVRLQIQPTHSATPEIVEVPHQYAIKGWAIYTPPAAAVIAACVKPLPRQLYQLVPSGTVVWRKTANGPWRDAVHGWTIAVPWYALVVPRGQV